MHAIRTHARALVRLDPAANDHLPALRVALGLAVPGIALVAGGRPDLIIYAAFGAFTGMYGRAETPRRRFTQQAQAATILVAGVGLGAALSALHARPWILVVTEAAFAGVGSVVADLLLLKPVGPFYGIFALGAVAAVPAGRVDAWAAVAICAATAVLCLLIGFAAGARSRTSRPTGSASRRPLSSVALVHAGRYVAAIAASGGIGVLLGIDHANWAMAGAAVPLAPATTLSRSDSSRH